MKADNAVIMAAGTSSRFVPLSYEYPKALTQVRGEILIERQIKQLTAAGILDIYAVVGYKAEQFEYLKDKYGIRLIYNSEYQERNNHASVWAARNVIANSYICSSDNYFMMNPFQEEEDDSYYAAVYADGYTKEWCIKEDRAGYIRSVTIGGTNAWYMLGHAFWSAEFSQKFVEILETEYSLPETRSKLWEEIFIEHADTLQMKIRKYGPDMIYEFDTMDELREFDSSYVTDTRSGIIKRIASELNVPESEIRHITSLKDYDMQAAGFSFDCRGRNYLYQHENSVLTGIEGKCMYLGKEKSVR